MRRHNWKEFLDQYTVPLEEWEWELLPFGKQEGRRKLRRVREDRSSGTETEGDEYLHGARLRIFVRTSVVVTKYELNPGRGPFASFDGEVLDTSDEEALTIYWRHRERHGWDDELKKYTKEYRFEHAACIPWEDILLIEYVGLAGQKDL